MNSSIVILSYCFLVIIIGFVKKVNCYQSFVEGAKTGGKTVINMFSNLLSFVVVLSLIKSCGIITFIEKTLVNLKIEPLLLIQGLIRPFSASSSMALMLDNFKSYPIDSFNAIASTLIHSLTDTTFYIITFYFGYIGITKYRHLLPLSLIVNILGFILALVAAFLIVSN